MYITQKQLSLADIFQIVKINLKMTNPRFSHFWKRTFDDYISVSFRMHYYAATGRPRKYPLCAKLWALILQLIFFDSHGFAADHFPALFQEASGYQSKNIPG